MEPTDFELVERSLHMLMFACVVVTVITPLTMFIVWRINRPAVGTKKKPLENLCNCKECRVIRAEIREMDELDDPDECPGLEGDDARGAWLNGWLEGIDDNDQYAENINGWDCGKSYNERANTR